MEEISFRSKSIEGVSTTTTGFIGPTRYGPTDLEPELITSLGESERCTAMAGNWSLATRADREFHVACGPARFSKKAARRLYVARIFRSRRDANDESNRVGQPATPARWLPVNALADAGRSGYDHRPRARFRGARLHEGPPDDGARPEPAGPRSTAHDHRRGAGRGCRLDQPTDTDPSAGRGDRAEWSSSTRPRARRSVRFSDLATPTPQRPGPAAQVAAGPRAGQHRVQVVTLDADASSRTTLEALPAVRTRSCRWIPNHERFGVATASRSSSHARPARLAQARTLPIVVTLGAEPRGPGWRCLDALRRIPGGAHGGGLDDSRLDRRRTAPSTCRSTAATTATGRPRRVRGQSAAPDTHEDSGLKAFEDIEDISIVAAPGSTFGTTRTATAPTPATIINLLISHATRMRYRIAVLDCGNDQTIATVRAMRAQDRLELRRALLPVGPRPGPDHAAARSTCRRAASSPASTRATTSTARSTRRRPTRS